MTTPTLILLVLILFAISVAYNQAKAIDALTERLNRQNERLEELSEKLEKVERRPPR